MRALVVLAHPCDDSFSGALADAAERGLRRASHDVDRIDLYAEGFVPAMSRAERAAYHAGDPIVDEQVSDHAARLVAADIVVFVYPTWWGGLPAMLKGWLERVMVPGVGFRFDERTGKVRPGLRQVRRIVGISTYGAPRWYVKLVNDNGRRIITRAFRMSCGWRARPRWLARYQIDQTDEHQRRKFIERVERRLAEI